MPFAWRVEGPIDAAQRGKVDYKKAQEHVLTTIGALKAAQPKLRMEERKSMPFLFRLVDTVHEKFEKDSLIH